MTYRAIVIGLGRIGYLLEGDKFRANPCTHVGAYLKDNNIDLVGGFDTNLEHLRHFLDNNPKVLGGFTNLEQFLIETKPEIISVAVSSSNHLNIVFEIYKYQLAHGSVKGILLEKPVGMNLEESLEIKRLCDLMKIKVVVCHDRRFYTEFHYFKKLITNQKYGKLKHLRIEINSGSFIEAKGRVKSPQFGGPMLHDGTHLVDLMQFLVGMPSHLQALCQRSNQRIKTEDTCLGNFFFQNGLVCSFLCGGKRKYFHFLLELGFEKARLTYAHNQNSLLVFEKGSYLLNQKTLKLPKGQNPYLVRLKHLLTCIEEDLEPIASLNDGIITSQLIDLVYQSAKKGALLLAIANDFSYPKTAIVGNPNKKG